MKLAEKLAETNRIAGMNGNGKEVVDVAISKPNIKTVSLKLRGNAPYVQNRFPEKAIQEMKTKMEAGSTAAKGKKRSPKDFQACYKAAMHISKQGWHGMPAPGFRAAMVSACRICGFKMTQAKLAVFIEADGYDKIDGMPLVKITKGKPRYVEHAVRNANGNCDIRPRPMWDEGWETSVRVRFDADLLTVGDVTNLLARVGMQVGIGEGRPDSPNSCGQGWGTFDIVND